tara:strand:+ start:282 stop:791 length:510 start_codon:yes stop_codon:yes gene_type:complete
MVLIFIILPFSNNNRLETWRGRTIKYIKSDVDWQQAQANKCMCSVGLFGKPGSGNGDGIPNADSDFIYAFAICEYGLIMGLFILCLYLLFFWRILLIARRIKSQFPYLVVLGLGTLLLSQALITMGVNLSLLPNTGQTLPLMSRGGSSILIMSLSIGIILNISSVAYEK